MSFICAVTKLGTRTDQQHMRYNLYKCSTRPHHTTLEKKQQQVNILQLLREDQVDRCSSYSWTCWAAHNCVNSCCVTCCTKQTGSGPSHNNTPFVDS